MKKTIAISIGTIFTAASLCLPVSAAFAAETAGPAAPGGVVSAPRSPQNGAVNADANKSIKTQTPGSNSFTQAQAQGHIEHAGYSDVSALTKTADGRWVGKAKKGGKTVNVSLDFKGAVSAK